MKSRVGRLRFSCFALAGLACVHKAPVVPPSADELVALIVPIEIGRPLDEAKKLRPALQPGGPSEWVDPSFEDGLQIAVTAGQVSGVAVTFGPEKSVSIEERLRSRLGSGIQCTAMPEGISSFQPSLWRLPDGTGVVLMRKQRVLIVRVEKPTSSAFEAALASCGAS